MDDWQDAVAYITSYESDQNSLSKLFSLLLSNKQTVTLQR